MPTLELVSLQDAQVELSLSGQSGAIMRQYVEYITQLEPDRAGKLTPEADETTTSVRRRLAAATQLLGKDLVVKRQGNTIFFWEDEGSPRRVAAAPRATRRVSPNRAQVRFRLPESVTRAGTSSVSHSLPSARATLCR